MERLIPEHFNQEGVAKIPYTTKTQARKGCGPLEVPYDTPCNVCGYWHKRTLHGKERKKRKKKIRSKENQSKSTAKMYMPTKREGTE